MGVGRKFGHILRDDRFIFFVTVVLTLQYSLLRTTEFSTFVKPLPILLFAWVLCVSPRRPGGNWVLCSLFMAALGDILLDLGPHWLLVATIPFLGSTLVLAVAFYVRAQSLGGNLGRGVQILIGLPIALSAFLFHRFLSPHMEDASTVGAILMTLSTLLLWRGVILYLQPDSNEDKQWIRFICLIGACGIVGNYLLYAINIGLHPIPRDLVIQLYFWGQAFVAWSFLKSRA